MVVHVRVVRPALVVGDRPRRVVVVAAPDGRAVGASGGGDEAHCCFLVAEDTLGGRGVASGGLLGERLGCDAGVRLLRELDAMERGG